MSALPNTVKGGQARRPFVRILILVTHMTCNVVRRRMKINKRSEALPSKERLFRLFYSENPAYGPNQ